MNHGSTLTPEHYRLVENINQALAQTTHGKSYTGVDPAAFPKCQKQVEAGF
jgi:hypothetical protein